MSKKKEFTILSVHSHKGGVGKTALVIGVAINWVFKYSKKAIIIDADFSGCSFAEIIPEFKSVTLSGLKGEFSDQLISRKGIQDNLKLRSEIYTNGKTFDSPLLYFLNDYVLDFPCINDESNSNYKDFSWKWVVDYYGEKKEIAVIPSSSQLSDVREMLRACDGNNSQYLLIRIRELIRSILKNGIFDIIIIDTSPGLHSLSTALLCEEFKEIINDVEVHRQRWMVLSAEEADFIASYRALKKYKERYEITPFLNRIKKENDAEDMARISYELEGGDSNEDGAQEKIEAIAGSFKLIKDVANFNLSLLSIKPNPDIDREFIRKIY